MSVAAPIDTFTGGPVAPLVGPLVERPDQRPGRDRRPERCGHHAHDPSGARAGAGKPNAYSVTIFEIAMARRERGAVTHHGHVDHRAAGLMMQGSLYYMKVEAELAAYDPKKPFGLRRQLRLRRRPDGQAHALSARNCRLVQVPGARARRRCGSNIEPGPTGKGY